MVASHVELPLAGKTALVTGVSRAKGIGWAIARRLLDDGASVYATGWSIHDDEMPWGRDPIDPAMGDEAGDRFLLREADLADPDTAAGLVADTVERFGGIDIVVAAHARSARGGLAEVTADELDACWAVNARSSVLLVQAFAAARPLGQPSDPGRVVLFTSGQHLGRMPGEIAYALSKGAIHQMTATLADAVADHHITLNCINPGPVDTGWAAARSDEDHVAIRAGLPAGRWGQPEDVANLVAWLVGPDGGWVTGQVINSEGGFRR